MATNISNDATQVLSGVDEATRNSIISQGSGNTLTSGEAKTLLAKFQGTQGVNPYSATNINQTMSQPVLAPDYSDPLGYRARLEGEIGLTGERTKLNEGVNALRQFDQGTTGQFNFLENQTLPMGVITGQQANQGRLRAQQRTSMADSVAAQQDVVLAKQTELEGKLADFQQQYEMKTNLIVNNPGAGIKYTDSIETAAKKLDTYAVKVKKEAYKDSLKQMAIQLGIKTSGKNTKALEKAISKKNKKALKLAEQQSELQLEGLRMDIANTKSVMANRDSGGSGGTADENLQSDKQDVLASFAKVKGNDNKVDPQDYNRLKDAWSVYQDPSKFDEYFQGYINPSRISEYSVTKTAAQLLGE